MRVVMPGNSANSGLSSADISCCVLSRSDQSASLATIKTILGSHLPTTEYSAMISAAVQERHQDVLHAIGLPFGVIESDTIRAFAENVDLAAIFPWQ